MKLRSISSLLCGIVIAILIGCSVAGEETDGFPQGLKQTLVSGGTFEFESHSPKIKNACFIHEYKSSRSVTEAFGINGAPLLNVGEMENLVLLEMQDGAFEYLGISLGYFKTPDLPYYKCFDAKGLVWTVQRAAPDTGQSSTLTVSGDLLQRINS